MGCLAILVDASSVDYWLTGGLRSAVIRQTHPVTEATGW